MNTKSTLKTVLATLAGLTLTMAAVAYAQDGHMGNYNQSGNMMGQTTQQTTNANGGMMGQNTQNTTTNRGGMMGQDTQNTTTNNGNMSGMGGMGGMGGMMGQTSQGATSGHGNMNAQSGTHQPTTTEHHANGSQKTSDLPCHSETDAKS